MKPKSLKTLIKRALKEDAPQGDITSKLFIDKKQQATAQIKAKEKITLFGVEAAKLTFKIVDPSLQINILKKDGEFAKKGETVLTICGNYRSLLLAERVALNFLQHLSGVATMAASYNKEIKGSNTKILDTRKTIPGLRELQKQAVIAGGGRNHRQGLSDMVLIKENHLEGLSFSELKKRILKAKKKNLTVEIECNNFKDLKRFLSLPVDIILLDNMSPSQLKKAIKMRKSSSSSAKFEASGNITLSKLAKVAETGVEYISSGSLTHSVSAADLSMLITHA